MMAAVLPVDGDGVCMRCHVMPPEHELIKCHTCATPWHVQCLSKPPESMADVANWECPDCSPAGDFSGVVAPLSGGSGELMARIKAIEGDSSLTDQEKAIRRQRFLFGGSAVAEADEEEMGKSKGKMEEEEEEDVLKLLGERVKCSFCMDLPERPVTTPCGHNFCLKCFLKWTGQGNLTCAKCRTPIPLKMASQPRINSALVSAIRTAKCSKSNTPNVPKQAYHFIHNEERPEEAFTTDRAKRAGKANACSGKIFVTIPSDHFGPILAENDPKYHRGVLVGDLWVDRLDCRQWGAHFPHVAGIAGQSQYGAQSVALSGGYEDDEDNGEWFLYTGSGGRDLSGNKRTNKAQSFDQKFEKLNEALRVSCKKGYPVRVVRSHKEKRSSYAPESGVRYDGVYRIEKCWRKVGIQGFKVCRYLFVRCDNEPAPWTSDELGDRPRDLPVIKELDNATDIVQRKENPAWGYDEINNCWKWLRTRPVSRKLAITGKSERKSARHALKNHARENLSKEFRCLICKKILESPLTTPCAHSFCNTCLRDSFEDKSFVRERSRADGRSLRSRKIIKQCPFPGCTFDIADFLQNPQINRELMDVIEILKKQAQEEDERLLDTRAAGTDIMENSASDNKEDEESSNDGSDEVEDATYKMGDNGKGTYFVRSNNKEDVKLEIVERDSGVDANGQNNAKYSRPKKSAKQRNHNSRCGAQKKVKKSEEVSNDAALMKSEDNQLESEEGQNSETNSSLKTSTKQKNHDAGHGARKKAKKSEEISDDAAVMKSEGRQLGSN